MEIQTAKGEGIGLPLGADVYPSISPSADRKNQIDINHGDLTPLQPVPVDRDIVPKHTVKGCVVAPLEQLLKAVTQSLSSCRRLCGVRVPPPRGFYETSYDPMLGAGTVRRLETRRVGQSARVSASNGGRQSC